MTNIVSAQYVAKLGTDLRIIAGLGTRAQHLVADSGTAGCALSSGFGPAVGLLVLSLAALLWGCGYEPVYASERPEVRLSVHPAPHGTPHVEAVDAAVAGVRRSFSTAGVLKAGRGYPRVVVEVVRVDEQAAGVRAASTPVGAQPRGRGSVVAIVGRAWVEEAEGAPHTRHTGELRRTRTFASAPGPDEEQSRYTSALRAAAHELGRALGQRILGVPDVTYEPM
jgi:hypothetical protein